MAVPQAGDRAQVAAEALNVVQCDQIGNIAGKVAHVVNVDSKNDEASVIANPLDREGSYIPLKYLDPITPGLYAHGRRSGMDRREAEGE